MHSDRHPLPDPAPGTKRALTVHRFGRSGARPKVWLQAALHADELPGTLALHHLLPLLAAAEHEGDLVGEISVVPIANPIGLAQSMAGRPLGRFAFDGSGNFNRGFTDFGPEAIAALGDRLGADRAANTAAIRTALRERLPLLTAAGEAPTLKRLLQRLACDADIALDLHCDQASSVHLYCGPRQVDALLPLAARLGARAVLTAEDSGDVPFDEALARPWWRLADAWRQYPIDTEACIACTVELRGEYDIDDRLAAGDARAIFAWLQERGAIAGTPPAAPPALCSATPLDGVEVVKATQAGIFVPAIAAGDSVTAGQRLGVTIDPLAVPGAGRSELHGTIAGVVFAHAIPGQVRSGDTVVKIAGRQSLPGRSGMLLEL